MKYRPPPRPIQAVGSASCGGDCLDKLQRQRDQVVAFFLGRRARLEGRPGRVRCATAVWADASAPPSPTRPPPSTRPRRRSPTSSPPIVLRAGAGIAARAAMFAVVLKERLHHLLAPLNAPSRCTLDRSTAAATVTLGTSLVEERLRPMLPSWSPRSFDRPLVAKIDLNRRSFHGSPASTPCTTRPRAARSSLR